MSKIAEKTVWFDDFLENINSTIRTHQLQIETGTANKEIKSLYESLKNGDIIELAKLNKETADKLFIQEILKCYLINLEELEIKTNIIAFDVSDFELLVWAQINQNDDAMENNLYKFCLLYTSDAADE